MRKLFGAHRDLGRPMQVPSRIMRNFGNVFLEWVYPPHCTACGAASGTAHALCPACWAEMPFISRPYCDRLGVPFAADLGVALVSPQAIADPPAFARGRAAVLHDGPARDMVHKLKYADRLDLARPMAKLMMQAGADLLTESPLLVPVPLHWTRFLRRKYNQSTELGRWIARETGFELAPHLLRRQRRTRQQVGMTRAERQRNLAGAIAVPENRALAVSGRHIIIIDDVRTTNSTANACAHALRRAGAAKVDVLTFALVTTTLDPLP